MPLFSAIDVGSNTIRLLIGKIEDNRIIDVYSDRKITRLGNNVGQTGMLQDENIEISIKALREFSYLIEKYGVKYVKAVATSALREASNSDSFIKRVFNDTGIFIEVISGEKEADLTLKGILSSFSVVERRTLPPSSAFIVDIGGGSTEWIFYQDTYNIDKGSIPVGVIKLAQKFIKTDPISKSNLNELHNEIVSVLDKLKNKIGQRIDNHTRFIGTAGTFTTIASIDLELDKYSREKIHLHTLPLTRLHEMSKKLLTLSLEERKKVRGLEPGRADLIIPGILFTISIMEFFKFDNLTISDHGLLEGALMDTKETIGKNISAASKS